MKTVYHEKQVALYCGKHAMNALLGEEKFVYEHGNTEIEIGDKINIYGICREQHEKFAKELAGLEAEAAIDPEAIESMIEAFDVETHIPCDADGNFVSATLTMCLKRLGFGVGRDDAEGATGGQDQEPFFTIDDIEKYVDKQDGNPDLLGYMVNIGGWHWIAVSARVGCPDEASPYFVIDSMAKKSWYMKNCSDAKALKKFFTKAINEAAGKMVEDAFGETYARQGAIIAVFKTPESYACAICGGVGVGAGADAEVATGGATEASPKSKGGKRKHKRKSVRRRRRSNRRRTIKKRK